MPANLIDVFSSDAFSIVSLTDAVNKIDHVPGQAGEHAFVGVGVPVNTTKINIEWKNSALSVIQTTPRGAPAPVETRDKRKLIALEIPHIPNVDVIRPSQLQDIRAFGSDELQSVEALVNEQMTKMVSRLDLTLEHLRLGALKGKILDADGSLIHDLYAAFGGSEPSAVEFPLTVGSEDDTLRVACQNVTKQLQRAAKTIIPRGAKVVALCGDGFFDTLISHPEVAAVFDNWQAAQDRLANDATTAPFTYGGISFEYYRGTDGVTGDEASEGDLVGEVGIASDECRIFLSGVPGLFTEKFAPADFMDSVNAPGLPRYARLFLDPEGKFAKLHVESNPLPVCLRPETLLKGVFA